MGFDSNNTNITNLTKQEAGTANSLPRVFQVPGILLSQ